MNLNVKRLHPAAILPRYATDGAACFDLHAAGLTRAQAVGPTLVVGTGLAFEVPPGHVLLIFSRSGHAFNFNTRLANCVGVIDSDYRGEVRVKLTADSDAGEPLVVRDGDRIAQGLVVPLPRVHVTEVADLSDTARGAAGFGSTGQ